MISSDATSSFIQLGSQLRNTYPECSSEIIETHNTTNTPYLIKQVRKQTLTKSTKQRRWQGRNVRETHDSMPRSRFDGCAAQCFKPPTTSKPEDSGFWNQHEQTDNKKAEIVWQTKKKNMIVSKRHLIEELNWWKTRSFQTKNNETCSFKCTDDQLVQARRSLRKEVSTTRPRRSPPLLFGWLDCRSD